jgi:hypothetical protein
VNGEDRTKAADAIDAILRARTSCERESQGADEEENSADRRRAFLGHEDLQHR